VILKSLDARGTRVDLTGVSNLFANMFRLTHVIFVGMWSIDPVDGTKDFFRGDQYGVRPLRFSHHRPHK
jgi:3'-phosphoadenosine 5'-phosphosulfate (PAPS) 3'-phosphatase